MRRAIAGSMVLALTSMIAGRVSAQTGPQLTPDQRSVVLLAIRAELTSRPRGWTARTSLCLRIEVREAKGPSREARVPPEVFRRLTAGGRKVVAADQCVTRLTEAAYGNDIHFLDANRRPAYMLDVAIANAAEGSDTGVEVSLAESQCAPLACNGPDIYTATKTKRGWTITYKDKVLF
jgi:hypothetical protein